MIEMNIFRCLQSTLGCKSFKAEAQLIEWLSGSLATNVAMGEYETAEAPLTITQAVYSRFTLRQRAFLLTVYAG
jgi:hypothetical protein